MALLGKKHNNFIKMFVKSVWANIMSIYENVHHFLIENVLWHCYSLFTGIFVQGKHLNMAGFFCFFFTWGWRGLRGNLMKARETMRRVNRSIGQNTNQQICIYLWEYFLVPYRFQGISNTVRVLLLAEPSIYIAYVYERDEQHSKEWRKEN